MKTLKELQEERECIAYALVEADGDTLEELKQEMNQIETQIEELTLPMGEYNETTKISN